LLQTLRELICDYSATRQIVYATHSPQFIDWEAICNGANIIRVYIENYGSMTGALSTATRSKIFGLLSDLNNPHVLGLDASEIFFLSDNIVLVEGQEDVIFYRKIMQQLNIILPCSFYGWGVGGASKMGTISCLLSDLGFSKVVGILDNNMSSHVATLSASFPNYKFFAIPADDVRSKPARQARPAVAGLIDSDGNVSSSHKESISSLFMNINKYMS
jgi:hypothetical protein